MQYIEEYLFIPVPAESISYHSLIDVVLYKKYKNARRKMGKGLLNESIFDADDFWRGQVFQTSAF